MKLCTYDIETYPNVFTFCSRIEGEDFEVFEISQRKNQSTELVAYLYRLLAENFTMVGFNNLDFDYLILDKLLKMGSVNNPEMLWEKADLIINAAWNDRFKNRIWESDMLIPQLDLFKLHHFDNISKSTSLKDLEFNMRLSDIQNLPFKPNTLIDVNDIDALIEYNKYDVIVTEKFTKVSKSLISMRENLRTDDYNPMNYNDTKIGKTQLMKNLSEKGVPLFTSVNGKRKVNQTVRKELKLKDCIFDWIKFDTPELQEVLDFLKAQTIHETKGVFNKLVASVNGFDFYFGLGGIHGSVKKESFVADNDFVIQDWDVVSYYPSIAIANDLYPEHLTPVFCEVYKNLKTKRLEYEKGTPENGVLKLALNGVYGDSNSKYSVFYDPKFTMTITLNGQFLLCVLAEKLMKLHGLKVIQINTDGLTIRYPKQYTGWVKETMEWWEGITNLQMEHIDYSRMFVRDVNNYVAEYKDGSVKTKGTYSSTRVWSANHSQLVVSKVAVDVLLNGGSIIDKLMSHNNIMDFMIKVKAPRNSKLMIDDVEIQRISRVLVTKDGGCLVKIMPPLPKSKTGEQRRIRQLMGRKVTVFNNITGADSEMIDYDYYRREVEKLLF